MPRARREQQILDVAGQVFASAGYHAASMDEISKRAGVSKPMIYAYFGSKEGLYVAYIGRAGQELVERLRRTFGPAADPSAITLRADEFLRFVEEQATGWRILFTEASASRPVAEEVAQLRRQITTAVRRLVTEAFEGRAAAEPDAADAADAVAHAIVGAGESLANWWLEHPAVDRERVTEWYVDVIRGSVAAVTRG